MKYTAEFSIKGPAKIVQPLLKPAFMSLRDPALNGPGNPTTPWLLLSGLPSGRLENFRIPRGGPAPPGLLAKDHGLAFRALNLGPASAPVAAPVPAKDAHAPLMMRASGAAPCRA